MSQPENFMTDAPVVKALADFEAAVRAALAARGHEMKLAAVLVHTDQNYGAGGLRGCDCMGCKRALADLFGETIGAKMTIQRLPALGDPAKPHKAVH